MEDTFGSVYPNSLSPPYMSMVCLPTTACWSENPFFIFNLHLKTVNHPQLW